MIALQLAVRCIPMAGKAMMDSISNGTPIIKFSKTNHLTKTAFCRGAFNCFFSKTLIIGTHQGRFEPRYLQNYLDEYVFRFNRRTSRSIGKKFMRIVQQVIRSSKTTLAQLVKTAQS